MSRISREDLETILGVLDPHYLPENRAGRMRFYERGSFRDLPELPKLALRWFEEIGSRGPGRRRGG
jgi:hypothetical protein